MSEEIIFNESDVDAIRKLAKSQLGKKALEYKKQFCRLDYYEPGSKQLEFHNSKARETALRAGNQLGKTFAGAAQMAMDAIGWYPDWYRGRRHVPPKIERPEQFIGWCASTSSGATRDGCQLKLLGDIGQPDGLGRGLLPLDNIIRVSRSRGIDAYADKVTLRREDGGTATIQFKSYEQGAAAFAGVPVDLCWLDEDCGVGPQVAIWDNVLSRFSASGGRLIWTSTPIQGKARSPWRRRFSEPHDPNDRTEILMGLDTADHIEPEKRQELLRLWKDNPNRDTVLFGADARGGGSVFNFTADQITHDRHPSTFATYDKWIWGCDLSHGGQSTQSSPAVFVLACHEVQRDIIYITHVLSFQSQTISQHAAAIRKHEMGDAWVLWPHDGNQGASGGGGETIAQLYKSYGLNMRPEHTTMKDGGYALMGGISLMNERFQRGALLLPKQPREIVDQFQNYTYDADTGKPIGGDSDMIDAVRQVVMGIRHAREMAPNARGTMSRSGPKVIFPSGQDYIPGFGE